MRPDDSGDDQRPGWIALAAVLAVAAALRLYRLGADSFRDNETEREHSHS